MLNAVKPKEHGRDDGPKNHRDWQQRRDRMTYAEKLARLAYVAAWLIIASSVAYAAYRQFLHPAPDPRTGTTGLAVETDAETGCQYVVTPWGGIVARLDPDGKPLCRAPVPKP